MKGKLTADVILEDSRWSRDIAEVGAEITAVARAAFRCAEGTEGIAAARANVAIVLTDDATIRRMNRDYRRCDKPTNVLSFPAWDAGDAVWSAALADTVATVSLGDVVIAYETVRREAEEQGKPLAHHLYHMVAHGVLHLLGYDHESEEEAAAMEGLEVRILEEFSVPDPYLAPLSHSV